MKVLHVYRTYFPDTQGGLEEVVRQICFNTKSLGVESRVFTLATSGEPSVVHRPEADVYRFNQTFEIASCGVALSAFNGFKRLVEWADVVHVHFPWPFADLLCLLVRFDKPLIVTYHSDIVRQRGLRTFYNPMMHTLLRRANRIIATSPQYVETSPVLKMYRDRVAVVPIGLDENVHPEVSESEVGAIKELVGDDFFLFVGVLRYYKGLSFLIDAVSGTNIKIVIAGDGPESNQLRFQALSLGAENVQFLGYVSDNEKIALMNLTRGIVFPSHLRSEAFGVTLLEGAMYSKPLISADIGTGANYVNEHGVTGVVVPPADPQALRMALLQLLEFPERSMQMGRAARDRFERLFTGQKMGASYLEHYEAVCASA
ncbi:glycosyltransferase WbpZ [Oleiphilus messinensis]|uniref:Glycosyltransferase WbpZ n=1 Tax=Oleiphilus messinensis TaxID=141451 RepID=A0A1Y0I3E3_9GAMM|nr:glycosyltransferase [Oleiphilus messinensis]ARU54992.1 glycosyltransferase WbpZ [Oleiphilus messinensis]